jgi:hypothetical protein
MARAMGFQKIAFATDVFQSAAIERFIQSYCPEMKFIPVVSSVLKLDHQRLPKIDSRGAYVSDFVPLSEREYFWERWQGTFGKKVKEEYLKEGKQGVPGAVDNRQ